MPAFASLNGSTVVRGVIALPRRGAWTARLMLDAEAMPTGPLTLTTNEGQVSYQGALVPRRGAPVAGRVELLMVGGAGGLATPLPPKAYRSLPARLVLDDLARGAGETIDPASDAALLARQLPHWVRLAGTMSRGLEQLVSHLGGRWRVTRAGQLLVVGPDAAPPSGSKGQRLDEAPGEAFALYALERLDLEPGTTFDDRVVEQVEHEISPDRIRTRVWFA